MTNPIVNSSAIGRDKSQSYAPAKGWRETLQSAEVVVMAKALRRADKQYRDALKKRHALILKSRADGMSLKAIGEAVGISEAAVCMAVKKAERSAG